jgi:hypothetical protein
MTLEEQYKKELGFDVAKIHDIGVVYYSNDYVEWLEKKVKDAYTAKDIDKAYDKGVDDAKNQ